MRVVLAERTRLVEEWRRKGQGGAQERPPGRGKEEIDHLRKEKRN